MWLMLIGFANYIPVEALTVKGLLTTFRTLYNADDEFVDLRMTPDYQ